VKLLRGKEVLVLAVAGLTGYVVVAVVLIWVGVWSGIGEADRAVLVRALRSEAAFLAITGVLMVGGLALILTRLFSAYVVPLRRMASDTRLMTAANRAHRLEVSAPAELASLAEAVNELADRYQASDEEISARVAEAQTELAQERNRLAALMAELTIPVLVCTVDGRILLYNQAARELLSEAYVGLGRSVFGVIDRSVFTHVLDRIHTGAARSNAVATSVGDRLLRVHVTPIAGTGEDNGDDIGGVVLTLEDLTRRAAALERRRALLRALTEQTRGAVASVRAAAETMLDYPDMEADGQRQFAGIIQDEAERLSAQVELATASPAEQLGDPSLLEDVLAGDLLAAIERRLVGTGVTASSAAVTDELWLSAESFGVVRTVADLVAWLAGKHGVDSVVLAVEPLDRYVSADVRWRGTPLDPAALGEWSGQPAVRQWMERQGYETWSGHDDERGAYVRLLLPRATAVPPSPVRDHGTFTSHPQVASRPEFYDFALFRPTEDSAEWDARTLGDLAYTVFDTETTGLAPDEGDEILSMGAVRVVNRRLLRTETYEQLVDPRRRIPAASYAIHGISGAMVRGQPVIEEVLREFARFAEDTVLVGHEVGFDMRFIARKEDSAGVRFTQPLLDTRLLSAVVHPEHERHSLEAIAERLGVSVVGRHTALGDAIVTGEVFVRLLRLLEKQGLRTLGDVRAASARATIATTSFSR
jgi:DNA polymerase-3 subunit epsilon